MHNQALFVLVRRYFPDFLDADAVVLWVFTSIQGKFLDQLLAQMTPTAFRKHGVFCVQLHAGHVAVLVLSCRTDAHIPCCNPLDAAIIVIKHFCSSKTGIYLDTQALCLLRKPATHIAHGDNIVAFIMCGFGDQETGELDSAFGAQVEKELIAFYRGVQRSPHFLPVGE